MKNLPSHALVSFYANIYNLEKMRSFISWSIETSQDVLGSNPDLIKCESEFSMIKNDYEAIETFEELKIVMYNQLFVILLSYVEAFLNQLIEDIGIAYQYNRDMLAYLESDQSSDIAGKIKKVLFNPGMKEKLKFLHKCVNWNNIAYDGFKNTIENYRNIRNGIVHNQSRVNEKDKKSIPLVVLGENGKIIIDQKFFIEATKELRKVCLEINNSVVRKIPALKI